MRKSNFLAAATLMAAVAFTSCNVNDEISDNVAVSFTAGIGEAATPQNAPGGTRASGTTWGNDAIGIFMVGNGGTTIAENAVNKQYTTPGSGAFTAIAGDEIYYPMDDSPVDFIAYYPYESGATLTTPINVTIGDQTEQPSFDLLYAKADNSGSGYKKTTGGNVALAFYHTLAKIVMNTTADASVGASLAGMTVTIKGMNTVNTFDLSVGALGIPETPADITPRTVTDGSVYDAIIMPDSYADGMVTVEFTVGTETFVWTLDVDDAIFSSCNEYSYDVKLTRTGVQVTSTINPWITSGNDRGGVTAE